MEQQCDGILQCPLGTDERDCLILTDSVGQHEVIIISLKVKNGA